MSSGQDGDVGRDPSLLRTTKRRITTNVKLINNQKHQKIKLHGTPTTKELKKKINENNLTYKVADSVGWLRKTGLLSLAGCAEGANLRGKLRLRADCGLQLGFATVGDTPSLTGQFVEKQASCTVPSLAPPPQAAPQHSKDRCPAQVST